MKERENYQSTQPELLSALNEEDIRNAIYQAAENLSETYESSFMVFKERNPIINEYLSEMTEFRRSFHFLKGPNKIRLKEYVTGQAIMRLLIIEKYKKQGSEMPRLSSDITETYFFDLMGGEDMHGEISILKGQNRLSPKLINMMTDEERAEKKLGIIIDRVHYKSRENIDSMLSKENLLNKVIGDVIPQEGYTDEGYSRKEFYDNLLLGQLDVYGPFNAHEEAEKFRRMCEIKTPLG